MSDVITGTVQATADRAIGTMATLREFDASMLPVVQFLDSDEIKSIRLQVNVSQAVFSKCLNVSLSTVKQWERGEKRPRGTALLLLYMVSKRGLKILFNQPERYS